MSTDYIEQWFFDVTPIVDLPIPDDLEHPPCMAGGITSIGRRWRQWRPDRTIGDCCWYHGGDWHDASDHAIALVDAATVEGHTGEEFADAVWRKLRSGDLTGWMLEAVKSLVTIEPIYVCPEEAEGGETFYIGRRHRALAMMQQGVRATVTTRLELLDPHTGEIIDL